MKRGLNCNVGAESSLILLKQYFGIQAGLKCSDELIAPGDESGIGAALFAQLKDICNILIHQAVRFGVFLQQKLYNAAEIRLI